MHKSIPRSFPQLFRTRWFYLVNILLIIVVGFSFAREMIRSRDIAKQIQSLQNQSQALQTQHLAIKDLKNAVQTESFVEREARLKLGLKKPGESLVILKNEKITEVTSAAGSGDPAHNALQDLVTQKSLANSSKWWYYFFNKQAYRTAQSL